MAAHTAYFMFLRRRLHGIQSVINLCSLSECAARKLICPVVYLGPHVYNSSHNLPNTQITPKIIATFSLGIVLNTVTSAANNAHRERFYLKRAFATLKPNIFSHCTKL